MTTEVSRTAFNSALETGMRSLVVLAAADPRQVDLGRMVQYDYLTVHSADAGGPPSLHPPLPLRSGELLVRRGLVERGLNLMVSRSLVRRSVTDSGFVYGAEDQAGAFIASLSAPYTQDLVTRAEWVVATFEALSDAQLDDVIRRLFDTWTTQFQPTAQGSQFGTPT